VVADVPLPEVIVLDADMVAAQLRFLGQSKSHIAKQWWGLHPSQGSRILDGLQPCSPDRLRLLALALGCDPRLLIVTARKVAA
jgi:hypothetical protein